jgi:ABC-type bacteriocin/lantibiotic exporter with double-glycine peptidase domain
MVDYSVHYLPQSRSDLCWAASTAMLVNYRDGTSKSDQDIAAEAGVAHEAGVSEIELEQVATIFKLSQVYPACSDITGWEQSLSESGPVICAVSGGNSTEHIIVVAGADPSQTEQGSIHVLDPWDGEGWLPLPDFQSKFDAAGQHWSRVTYKS